MKRQNDQRTRTFGWLSGWILVSFAMLFGVQPTLAQETFSFQGRLTNPDGTPVNDGSHSVRFQLFDAPTGGSPQWGEAHAVTTDDGVFSVLLGTETMLNLNAFSETPYLLLIVDNEEMEPRVPLTAVPYAMKSYRLDEAALVAGANVSITKRSDGTLQIGATGGSGGGLTSVSSDATLAGNGTSAAPLGIADGSVTGVKLSNNALVAGVNVDIARRGNGSLEISATGGGGGGGLTSVSSDATLSGNGTAGSPLSVADGSVTGVKLAGNAVTTAKVSDGAVTGVKLANNAVTMAKVSDGAVTGVKLADGAVTGGKLADGALIAGSNVTITRQAGGALQVASAAGGLTQVASDGTLSGIGTAGSPLMVASPLVLTSAASSGAVRGENTNGSSGWLGGSTYAVAGDSDSGTGVGGFSNSGKGVYGYSTSGNGVSGRSNGSGFGVYGEHGSNWGALGTSAFAGAFTGNVIVLGNLAKSSGSFKIDHPLDPAGKYLSHSFVESPDMMNVYNGNVTTDANGTATITLPDYFEVLNRDFRYQLTAIGAPGPNLYIAEKINGNRFKIAGGTPGMEVSWQVTGIRQDAWAEEHRIVVEEDKPAEERGYYLHPTLFGQPQQRSILWARDPQMMREIQEQPVRLEEERRQIEQEYPR